jgi:glycosyltransferase involved in cell wall biosynthesis
MKILVVGAYSPSLVKFRGPLLTSLVGAGCEVYAAASGMTDDIQDELRNLSIVPHEIPFSRTGLNPISDLKSLFHFWRLLVRLKPDLVLTYTIKPNIWGAFAAHLAGVQSIALVTGLGYAFTKTGNVSFKHKLTGRVAQFLYRRATNLNLRVIFQNPDDQRDFIASGCISDVEKLRIVNGSGVDLDYYRQAQLPATPDFLMISRFIGAKGVREYALAALEVKQTHPLARFRLIGFFDDGPDSIPPSELKEWTEGGVECLGASDDVRPHLANCRVFVLPSYREGTPRTVLEAMATGRPILTTNVPGCRETVSDGVNGFLVPVRDHEALADRMRWMIDNPVECERMGDQSLCLVREKYDVDKVNRAMLQHLQIDQ